MKDVDGRDKPGHDEVRGRCHYHAAIALDSELAGFARAAK
jgi:hypothetical protein